MGPGVDVPDEQALREKAREAMRVGKIPIAKPARIFGGLW
jgi:hypothetical protein